MENGLISRVNEAPLTSEPYTQNLHIMKTLPLLILIAAMNFTAFADTALNPTKDASQATVLQTRTGQQVELHLKSGEKISGKVASVGSQLVHLTTLTGMEMFEATVVISDISAVVVRTAK